MNKTNYINLKQLINHLVNLINSSITDPTDVQNKQALINETKELINRNFFSTKIIKPNYTIPYNKFYKPWSKNSHILYVSLLIDENSKIGKSIKTRTVNITGVNPFDFTKPVPFNFV